jgi:carbon-monoxide dehydrogenase medium subunit
MKEFKYHSPETVVEVCELLNKYKGSAQVLAGGTDLIPKMYHRMLAPIHVINLKKVSDVDLKAISYDQKSALNLGTLVRFNDMIYSEEIKESHPILIEISKDIASHQVRNLATIGGNLCNAAPSADSAPVLIALDSQVTLQGPNECKRTMMLEKFFTGPGNTALMDGEILTQIKVPAIKDRTGIAYIKHTTRRALEIAIVGVAGLLQLEPGSDTCISARIVVGAAAPTPLRVKDAEEQLLGVKVNERTLEAASEKVASAVKPISDVRGNEDYRKDMARVLSKRVLEQALERAKNVK